MKWRIKYSGYSKPSSTCDIYIYIYIYIYIPSFAKER